MKFKLEFSMDNAAFEDYPASEVATTLQNVGISVVNGGPAPIDGDVRDYNGNKIGTWEITE